MRTFRNRLLVLIIGLVIVAQTVTLVAVLARTENSVLARGADELASGASVARQVIAFRAAQLSAAVGVLASDFGLREAVASGDRATIDSAARNHSRRIGADLFLVLDQSGALVTSSHGETSLDPRTARDLMVDARPGTGGVLFLTLGSDVFQILPAAVRGPEPLGWVVLGFLIDRTLALEVRQLVDVELAFVAHGERGPKLIATTLPDSAHSLTLRAAQIADPTQGGSRISRVGPGDSGYLAHTERLAARGDGLSLVVLKPMSAVLAPYTELRSTLGWITLFAVLLAAFVGTALGRAATRPIDRLVAGAQRIERGEYDADFEFEGPDEFEHLASALGTMQRGIAEREARIVHQTLHDPLTGLPNRKHLEQLLAERLVRRAGPRAGAAGSGEEAADPRQPTTLLLVEAVNLGQFTASLGFELADQVLLELSSRLQREAPRGSIVARLEGARFAIATPLARTDLAESWARKLHDGVALGLHVAAFQARVELAIGIARAPEHGDRPAELLRSAETALEGARHGHSTVVLFASEQDQQQRRRVQLSNDLPEAIAAGTLTLVFQAKVDFAKRRIRGAEVLARWTHPAFGPVTPDEFLPLADQTGSGGLLTRWVLRSALDALAQWHAEHPRLTLAVNLTASDIADPALPDFVLEQLRQRRLPPTALLLEITESAVMLDPEAAARHMEQLRYAGLRFSIDDFGTGHSSLALLNRLPFDELKIDKSFVKDAASDADAVAIVRATIELARSLALRVVAEGVETEASWSMLKSLGCDYAQGWLIARPLPAAQFLELVRAAGPAQDDPDDTARLGALASSDEAVVSGS